MKDITSDHDQRAAPKEAAVTGLDLPGAPGAYTRGVLPLREASLNFRVGGEKAPARCSQAKVDQTVPKVADDLGGADLGVTGAAVVSEGEYGAQDGNCPACDSAGPGRGPCSRCSEPPKPQTRTRARSRRGATPHSAPSSVTVNVTATNDAGTDETEREPKALGDQAKLKRRGPKKGFQPGSSNDRLSREIPEALAKNGPSTRDDLHRFLGVPRAWLTRPLARLQEQETILASVPTNFGGDASAGGIATFSLPYRNPIVPKTGEDATCGACGNAIVSGRCAACTDPLELRL